MHANRLAMPLNFVCHNCSATTRLTAPSGWRCDCGSPWDLPPGPPFAVDGIDVGSGGVWRYRRQIRLPADAPLLTLGEGNSPWLRLRQGPWVACAHMEPTASFKARGAAVLVTWARQVVEPPLIEDSSGNAGGAVAAYAAAAGLRCRIYVPAYAPAGKKTVLRALGAEVVEVDGERAQATAAALADTDGTYTSHAWNPMFLEGIKTLAFQWWEERDGRLPARVYVPSGQGSVVLGLQQGFAELRASFPDLTTPALVAVQHRTVAPLVEAVAKRQAHESPEARPEPGANDVPSMADGIMTADPVRRDALVDAIVGSGGHVVTIGNAELVAAHRRLAANGLWVEPTAAVGLAGYAADFGNDANAADADSVVVLTGHGLKAGVEVPQ